MAIIRGELTYPLDSRRNAETYLRSTSVAEGIHSIAVVEADGENIESVFVRHVQLRSLGFAYRACRRGLDILVAGTLLLILSPILLLAALAVKLTSRGPVLFRSTRVGMGGLPITFVKFRTMVVDAEGLRAQVFHLNEKSGPVFKAKGDPRVTPIGRFLRHSSIDELPQLWHVFTGKLTLVGPRPHLPSEVAQYDDHCWDRLAIKPGLTCYWQVQGRSELDFEAWIELDLKYVREMSPAVDLGILAKTPLAILTGRGAY
ncbi:MAG: sugar transferase [Fimbriimonadaceae bacterium]